MNQLVLEQMNFANDIIRSGNCRTRPILKNRSDTLFINLDNGGWVRSKFFMS